MTPRQLITAADAGPAWRLAEDAAHTVRRYPEISESEIDWLVAVYPQMSMLQVALMTCDEETADGLAAFHKDHGRRIRTPFRQYGALLAPVVMLWIVVVWQLFK